ncbi:HTTM domain-containing protein [Enhygromyxa salina]|uniref:HTTM domain-containing protein n=1 Tax=Enhygromyxa salina TaxID=215803 RepID=A0A2S9XQA0_9BACT|nr:HTTM domain-containing protein [Enhygromyxa salina]PRP94920.1 hypothetical protein ENSA7_77430 [Enhygromyxa salina]
MSRLLDQLDRWWFCPAPALRLAVLRVLIIGYGLIWLVGFAPLLLANLRFAPEQFAPTGVVSLLDAPVSFGLGAGIWLVTVLLGVAALLGWRFRVLGPVYALGLLWVASYRNSWGMIFHTENLLVVHTLIVVMLPASDAWSLDARARPSDQRALALEPDARYGWGPKLMATVTALAYVLAGVAKLRTAGWAWLDGDVLLSHVGWDNLRKQELGSTHSPLGAALCAFPSVFIPLSWVSVALELGAPLALFGRRLAWVWSIGIWCFHLGVVAIMWIVFAYPLSGVAFAPLFAVERPVLALAAWARQRRPDSPLSRLLPE